MYTNVSLAAPIGVVLLLGAGLVMLLLSVVFLYLVVTRKFSVQTSSWCVVGDRRWISCSNADLLVCE